MRTIKTFAALAVLFALAACGGRRQKKQEAGAGVVAESVIDAELRKMGKPGTFSSGVVAVSVPRIYYELTAPGLDTLYFNRFYPYPIIDESSLSGPDGEPVRSWLAQFGGLDDKKLRYRRLEGMGFAISEDGMIATSADLFTEKVDTMAVKEFYMEYLQSGKSGYDAAKLAKIKTQDIRIRKKGDNQNVTVRFFQRRFPNMINVVNPPGGDTLEYRVYRDQPHEDAELLSCGEHIAIVQLACRKLPLKTHVFKPSGAKALSVGDRIIRLETMDKSRYDLLIMRGGARYPVTVGETDSATGIFDYNFSTDGIYDGRPGSPLIDSLGNIVGMHLKQLYEKGAHGERKSYGIAAEQIHKQIVSISR